MKKSILVIVTGITLSLIVMGFTNSERYRKVIEHFDIYSELIKVLDREYIYELDLSTLLNNSLKGIFESLDPYTVYYPEQDNEEVEIIQTGIYTGFGISVKNIDSILTITSVAMGTPAHKSNVRPGDIILEIDTAKTKYMKADSLAHFSKGEEGSTVFVKVLRGVDTLYKTFLRKRINQPDVLFSKVFDGNTGYIKLVSFTNKTLKDVQDCISALKKESKIDNIIIDVRSNPGGRMISAVDVCDIFLPENELVVSTKGRNMANNREYKTSMPASEKDTRLVVMINDRSASASECLAGAIQDLGRGVIIGEKSYGKGLVQSFFNLPYDGYVKMTTAKYYTPSGRCIQKRSIAQEYHEKDIDTNQVFYTSNGNKVVDSDGIEPDSTVKYYHYEDIVLELYYEDIIFKYAVDYARRLDTIKTGYRMTDADFNAFLSYIDSIDYQYDTDETRMLQSLKEEYVDSLKVDEIKQNLDALQESIHKYNKKQLIASKKMILSLLEQEVYAYFYMEEQYYDMLLDEDPQALAAREILKNGKYEELLKPDKDVKN